MIIVTMVIVIFLIILLSYIYSSDVSNCINNEIVYDYKLPSVDQLNTNKIIWSYWDQAIVPITVKLARYTWYKHNPDYLICILNDKTVSDYIDMTTLPKKYKQISVQKKADVIRLALLEKYGGTWLDSTIYLSQPLTWDYDYDVGGYYADFYTTDIEHPVYENWFISAPKNSPLITAWKKEFYKGVDSDDYELYIKNMKTDFQKLDNHVYLMMHCCFLKIISEKKYRLKVFPASKGPFEYLVNHNWNSLSAITYLLTSKDELPPVIKLRGIERTILEWMIYYMKNKSILHRLIW